MIDLQLLAQATPGAPQGEPMQNMIVMVVAMMAIFYFMIIRPQKRKEKDRREMLGLAKKGQKVVFGGGMVGVISNVKEKVFVIKIADNVKVEVLKAAVTNIIEKGDPLVDGETS